VTARESVVTVDKTYSTWPPGLGSHQMSWRAPYIFK